MEKCTDSTVTSQINGQGGDPSQNLYRMLTPSVMNQFITSGKDVDILHTLYDNHIKTLILEKQIQRKEGEKIPPESRLKITLEIDRYHRDRRQLIARFDHPFQTQGQAGQTRTYSQSPGDVCDRLIALTLALDDAVLVQNDATLPDEIRSAWMEEANSLFRLRTHLQKCLAGMLEDVENNIAVFPPHRAAEAASVSLPEPVSPPNTPEPAKKAPQKTGKKVRHILALACTGHGASITYLGDDGAIRSSVLDRWAGTKYTFLMGKAELERLMGRSTPLAAYMYDLLKLSYGRFPTHLDFESTFPQWLPWLLKDLNVSAEDIDLFISGNCLFVTSPYSLAGELSQWLPNAEIFLDVEHHTIHQCQAFWQSGFEEAAIVTLDTCGEDLERTGGHKISGTISQMDRKGNRKVFREFFFPQSSAGLIYAAANHHIGFAQGQEGKTMGLAPYGKPDLYRELVKYLYLYPDGSFDFLSHMQLHDVFAAYEYERPRVKGAEFTQKHSNIAYAAQTLIEDIISNAFKAALRITGQKNLVFAGGIALNSVANEVAYRAAKPENIYIPPNPSDSGQSLGFALYAAHELAGWEPRRTEIPEYLGPPYTKEEIEQAARKTQYHVTRVEDPDQTVAQCIANGHIIARFSGGAEFGPRALGNRSILADPRRKDMKDYLNSRVKRREGFRPFAPTVLLEHVSDWFDLNERSPYMLRVVNVPEKIRDIIPAIVHVDGTARVQTVDKQENPGYYNLISRFYQITNVPVVLNTSFNVGGKPIAETPQDAVECFESTNIDVLLLEDWILSKRPLKEFSETER